MKRSTARWTTAIAAAALLALPASSLAQTPATPQPAAPAQSQAPAGSQASPMQHDQHSSAQEHLRQAQAALNDVPSASLTGRAKVLVTQLRRHINALEKSTATADTAGTANPTAHAAAARGNANWSTEVAAADKIFTELLGSPTTSGIGNPTGTTGTAATGTTKSKSATTITLDDTARTKLMEARTHLTQFAAAMSGTAPAPAPEPAATTSAPVTEPAAAAPASGVPNTPNTPATSSMTSAPGTGTPPATPSSTAPVPANPQTVAAEVDPEAAKRHLTAARDMLSQITQLPAAAQLTGEVRTNVSQLISNFNELITATTDWRVPYDKVTTNLTALLGPPAATASVAPATATPGAVGTTGTTVGTLDPALSAKLADFRNYLMQFEKAAGGK
jgi:hypothetical protein